MRQPVIAHGFEKLWAIKSRSRRPGRVAAVPGSYFGTEGHIRISYCCGEQMLERGMDRLEAFLEKLKQERRT